MIDFQKLMPQICELAVAYLPEAECQSARVDLALAAFKEASSDPERFDKLLKDNAETTFWPLAQALENPGQTFELKKAPSQHTIVACDGSQIMPSRHEIASCYLINIGAAVFHYKDNEDSQAILSSFPQLFHRQEDIFPLLNKRRMHVDEGFVSFQRSLMEFSQAAELAETHADNKQLVLFDGSLIPFNIERSPADFQAELLLSFEQRLDSFAASSIPLAGFISYSGSAEIVNALRVWSCPYAESRCQIHCASLDEQDFPCSTLWPLSDRNLMAARLPEACRSAFFLSRSRWCSKLALRNRVCFAYLNTGFEIARIEVPFWLFQDKDLLDLSLSLVINQVEKGFGYPIALAEAHNKAVIKQHDRSRFFSLLEQELLKQKQQVSLSPKERKKRSGFV